jgi:hypothetical protein
MAGAAFFDMVNGGVEADTRRGKQMDTFLPEFNGVNTVFDAGRNRANLQVNMSKCHHSRSSDRPVDHFKEGK